MEEWRDIVGYEGKYQISNMKVCYEYVIGEKYTIE